jgi:glutamate synthase (NADPH/NADH)
LNLLCVLSGIFVGPQVYPRDFKRVVNEKKAKEAAAKAAKQEAAKQEAELSTKDAFVELQKLAAKSPAPVPSPLSNGASKVSPSITL